MLDRMTYTNHLGQVIEFGATQGEWSGLLIKVNNVRDYTWLYDSTNNKLSNFRRGVVTKSLPYFVVSEKADELKNRITSIADADIKSNIKGTLDVNGNKLRCFIFSDATTEYLLNRNFRAGTLGIVTDDASWRIYLKKQEFLKKNDVKDNGLDYAFDYPFDYSADSTSRKLLNTSLTSNDFIMTIAGAVTNPTISIDGHVYKFNISLKENEYLVINSMDKTIWRTTIDDVETVTNEFNCRNKTESVFEKIPYNKNGMNDVMWDGSFSFDIVLIYEQSEPKWGDE